MGIEAIYRRSNTNLGILQKHPVYQYLLRNLVIERPNHVWAAEFTYVPMRRGFVYLVVILDWATSVVSHKQLELLFRLFSRARRGASGLNAFESLPAAL